MTATCLPIGLTSLHVACVCACQNICICALCAHSHVFHKPVDVRHMHSKTDCHMYDMCVLAMMLGAVTIVQRNSVGEHVPPCCPSRFFSRCPSRCCVAAHACARAYGVLCVPFTSQGSTSRLLQGLALLLMGTANICIQPSLAYECQGLFNVLVAASKLSKERWNRSRQS